MQIFQSVYHSLLRDFPLVPPEIGAILGMRQGIICSCLLDYGVVQHDRGIYIPNVDRLNEAIAQWQENKITFCGIAHSHPPGQERLSNADIAYIEKILSGMPDSIPSLFFPLVFPGEKILSFLAVRKENGVEILTDNIITL